MGLGCGPWCGAKASRSKQRQPWGYDPDNQQGHMVDFMIGGEQAQKLREALGLPEAR